MIARTTIFAAVLAMTPGLMLHAQVSFSLDGKPVQVHGFVSQGFAYTSGNNWLTMKTNDGSPAMTDLGVNISSQLTDKLRVGMQVYDRNLGQLGNFRPSIDWAFVDYRAKDWLGFRAGKVKTTRGLYTDTQDMDFLHTFAVLPQSLYPLDIRDATIAHLGGDVYGRVELTHGLGALSYTVFAGRRSDSLQSGYPYFLAWRGTTTTYYGGLQYGADLRWETPLKGLLVGIARVNQDITGEGMRGTVPNVEHSKHDWANDFFGQYTYGNFRFDAEYRRYIRDQIIRSGTAEDLGDMRGWYTAGSYRVNKYLELGAYYSRYNVTSTYLDIHDQSKPNAHDYDKVVSARIDVTRFWNFKIEGHFLDGYGLGPYPNGFYPQDNSQGFAPNTRALVLKTGFSF